MLRNFLVVFNAAPKIKHVHVHVWHAHRCNYSIHLPHANDYMDVALDPLRVS